MKEQPIERIPIAEINIANPRPRSRGRWLMIVANIREVGLKKPITVVRRSELGADGKRFDLVCGQGRIEAFLALGETSISSETGLRVSLQLIQCNGYGCPVSFSHPVVATNQCS